MFSHVRFPGLLALSATLLMQPGAWCQAACPDNAPQIRPITDVDAYIGTHFRIPPAIVLGAPLPVADENARYSSHIALRDSDIAHFADYAFSPELAHLIHITTAPHPTP